MIVGKTFPDLLKADLYKTDLKTDLHKTGYLDFDVCWFFY